MYGKEIADGDRYRIPACSICEDEGIVSLKLEMPGVAKEGLEIKVEGNELSVLGRRGAERESGTYLLRERRGESYRKLFTLDESISRDKIDAAYANGILSLTLHVREAAKPRRIAIA
ncbi:MAG TPA: Hsp20 family protein [Spirochaetales bacterium]|nr:Hsp20 family protein [Spirochaetales bacterium]HRY55684.1 Hsp20 family protein [Spirochaetia bacterium]